MEAIILAGGKGRRLQPYTAVFPKPLMPVGESPILEIIVKQLKGHGFMQLTFAVGHLAGLIQAYFDDGRQFGVQINYSLEEKPLGTAGPLSLIGPPQDDFLVMNGDVLTDLDFGNLMQSHRDSNCIATLAVFTKQVPISLGVLELDENRVVGYTEKPTLHYPVSTGIYCFRPDILNYLPKNKRFDLPDLVTELIASGEKVNAYSFDGHWLDIGRPEDYEKALEIHG